MYRCSYCISTVFVRGLDERRVDRSRDFQLTLRNGKEFDVIQNATWKLDILHAQLVPVTRLDGTFFRLVLDADLELRLLARCHEQSHAEQYQRLEEHSGWSKGNSKTCIAAGSISPRLGSDDSVP